MVSTAPALDAWRVEARSFLQWLRRARCNHLRAACSHRAEDLTDVLEAQPTAMGFGNARGAMRGARTVHTCRVGYA